jgi:hypothetical protein
VPAQAATRACAAVACARPVSPEIRSRAGPRVLIRAGGHGLVTKHEMARCTTSPCDAGASLRFSTLGADAFCDSTLKGFRNQQVLGSSPSAGSKLYNNLERSETRGASVRSPLGCSRVADHAPREAF